MRRESPSFPWLLLLLVCSECTLHRQGPELGWRGIAPTPQDEAPCAHAVNAGECARALEAIQLARTPPGVMRIGRQLRLELRGGAVKTFEDSPSDVGVEDLVEYRFVATRPELDAYLVHAAMWEGTSMLLVSRGTGHVEVLDSAPIPSPDDLRFVTSSASEAHDDNAIRIYRWTASGVPALEWSWEPVGWGPGFPRWDGPTTLTVPMNGWGDGPGDLGDAPRAVVRQVSGSWRVIEDDGEH